MNEQHREAATPPLVVEYGQQPAPWRPYLTPESGRRVPLAKAAVAAAVTLAYWFGLVWTCRPALNLFCVGPFIPMALACSWGVLGGQLLRLGKR